ncbi:LytR/AlgR family response regulator transcription factor [Portibacter lacus]|uniref:DNA-binding response regulator n=1 Tax=Portibacter lacus TaxID=1099794 RepID=A0AA37WHX9_9BACT|nr:response regulator [Portibacter lacus]GLR20189.1 DNA-binding response regulator [Portibacter lacus]
MKITCIIVEDEPLALKRTSSYIRKTPSLDLLASFENASEALVYLQDNTVDLIFLDIQMDEMTGIDFLESVHIDSQVIFTTAYEEYAIKGFELNVLDYLLKPFHYARFLQAVNKFQHKTSEAPNYIFIKSGYQLEKIFLDDILYIDGMGDYRRIHTTNKKIMTIQTFSELEHSLSNSSLKRVHKSYMVALDKINRVERNVIIIGEERIPISNTYKDDFYRSIDIS